MSNGVAVAHEIDEIGDVIQELQIGPDDGDIVRQAYAAACNTVKLYKLQHESALAMQDQALADQFAGATRRAAEAVLDLRRKYPWLSS